ncbi:MAG: hypothetical protein V3T38_01295 [Gammaproteobacteria bacterium]
MTQRALRFGIHDGAGRRCKLACLTDTSFQFKLLAEAAGYLTA